MNFPQSNFVGQLANSNQQIIPKKQQWALINQFKALEFERMKKLQKSLDHEKKKHFKEELDNQLINKNDVSLQQKEADRRYYQYITRKAEHQKQKEEREKYNKIMKRKQVEEQNQYYLDKMRNSKVNDNQPGYNLDIGIKSQTIRRKLEQSHKKQMLDTLDKQLQMKAEQRKNQRNRSLELDEANLRYQYEQFDKRSSNGRYFGQNQRVYEYYKHLNEQRKLRQRQFEHKIIDEAAVKKMEQEDFKRYLKEKEKSMKTNEMKHTLDQQIEIQHLKQYQAKRANPEEHTYSVIGNMFRQKKSPYNKQEYSEYLRKQAEQMNMKKKKDHFMSEQQYRINLNQLNRAVSGNYAHQKYIDRSVGAIGDGRVNQTQINQRVNDEDAQVIRMRLESIKNRPTKNFGHNDSYMY